LGAHLRLACHQPSQGNGSPRKHHDAVGCPDVADARTLERDFDVARETVFCWANSVYDNGTRKTVGPGDQSQLAKKKHTEQNQVTSDEIQMSVRLVCLRTIRLVCLLDDFPAKLCLLRSKVPDFDIFN
jgi:hypothetical protein